MNIVLVDDNPGETFLFHQVLNELNYGGNLNIIHVGGDAKEYFSKPETYIGKQKPDLIILDKNLGNPRVTGIDLLKEIKKHIESEKIAIVMITMYHQEDDKKAAEALGIDRYYIKPAIDQLKEVIKEMVSIVEAKNSRRPQIP